MDESDPGDELEPRQLALVDAQVNSESKSLGVAYLLWWLLGAVFAHRLYLNRKGLRYSAVAIIAEILGYAVSRVYIAVGVTVFVLLVVVLIADAYRIPRWIDEDGQALRVRLIEGLLSNTADSPERTARLLTRDAARQRLESLPVKESAAQSSGPIFNDDQDGPAL